MTSTAKFSFLLLSIFLGAKQLPADSNRDPQAAYDKWIKEYLCGVNGENIPDDVLRTQEYTWPMFSGAERRAKESGKIKTMSASIQKMLFEKKSGSFIADRSFDNEGNLAELRMQIVDLQFDYWAGHEAEYDSGVMKDFRKQFEKGKNDFRFKVQNSYARADFYPSQKVKKEDESINNFMKRNSETAGLFYGLSDKNRAPDSYIKKPLLDSTNSNYIVQVEKVSAGKSNDKESSFVDIWFGNRVIRFHIDDVLIKAPENEEDVPTVAKVISRVSMKVDENFSVLCPSF
jgi:hypothetical protein